MPKDWEIGDIQSNQKGVKSAPLSRKGSPIFQSLSNSSLAKAKHTVQHSGIALLLGQDYDTLPNLYSSGNT